MKLLNEGAPTTDLMAALAKCVAHRCLEHREIPPLNMNEGNGSSECGVCAAESVGERLGQQLIDLQEREVILPTLDGYADRLTHHAILTKTLRDVRDRLKLAGLAYDDIDAVLGDGRVLTYPRQPMRRVSWRS